MNYGTSILIFLVFMGDSVWARNCTEDERTYHSEQAKINGWGHRIGQLNAEIPALNLTIEDAQKSIPGYKDSIKNCTNSVDSLSNAERAVGIVLELFDSIMIFDEGLKARLHRIVESMESKASWDLRLELRDYVQGHQMDPVRKTQLLGIARALELLSEKDQAWRADERMWIERIRVDVRGVQYLAERLKPLHDKIISDLKIANENCANSKSVAATYETSIANANKRIAEVKAEVAGLSSSIAKSQSIQSGLHFCPLPKDPDSRFF